MHFCGSYQSAVELIISMYPCYIDSQISLFDVIQNNIVYLVFIKSREHNERVNFARTDKFIIKYSYFLYQKSVNIDFMVHNNNNSTFLKLWCIFEIKLILWIEIAKKILKKKLCYVKTGNLYCIVNLRPIPGRCADSLYLS